MFTTGFVPVANFIGALTLQCSLIAAFATIKLPDLIFGKLLTNNCKKFVTITARFRQSATTEKKVYCREASAMARNLFLLHLRTTYCKNVFLANINLQVM